MRLRDVCLRGCIVVKAAAAVGDALAVVLPHAGAVERLVVPEVGVRDVACAAAAQLLKGRSGCQ